jgi:hypothetical protein
MPTISMFFGFVVQMYWRDQARARLLSGFRGFGAIETGEIIAGALPRGALRVIKPWIERRRPELRANWERGTLRQPFERVPGADVE